MQATPVTQSPSHEMLDHLSGRRVPRFMQWLRLATGSPFDPATCVPRDFYAGEFSPKTLTDLAQECTFQKTLWDKEHSIMLHVGPVLGKGAEGHVFQAYVRDMPGYTIPQRLALKVVRVSSETASFELLKMIKIWNSINHPSISQLLGLVRIREDEGLFGLLSPLACHGTLADLDLRSSSWETRRSMLVRLAMALEYLHTDAGVVHGDIKAENVLIADDGSPILTDFGLSTYVDRTENPTRTDMRGKYTTRFAAPEVLSDAAYGPLPKEPLRSKTTQSDIYAFGCLIYQVHTGHAPWRDKSESGVIKAVISGRLPRRPEPGDGAPFSDEMWNLCLQCWDRDPRRRPTAGELVQILKTMPVLIQ